MKNQNSHQIKSFTVSPEWVGQRLDKALASDPQINSRNRALHLIEKGFVKVNNKAGKPSYNLKDGDLITLEIPQLTDVELTPMDLPLDILFEDQDIIVINKPAGLVVHPAAGHAQDTLVNALIAHTQDLSMKFGEKRPGIVHRLDRDTSGVLVIAKNDKSHEALVGQFKERSVHRLYEAIVIGEVKKPQGRIESYLARHPLDRKRFASLLGPDKKNLTLQAEAPTVGKWSITNYAVKKIHGGLTLVELKLETGRTHQIRVHLSELGHPIFGDGTYGADKKLKQLSVKQREFAKILNRFLLHACRLEFNHPKTGERLRFYVEWPDNDLSMIKEMGLK